MAKRSWRMPVTRARDAVGADIDHAAARSAATSSAWLDQALARTTMNGVLQRGLTQLVLPLQGSNPSCTRPSLAVPNRNSPSRSRNRSSHLSKFV